MSESRRARATESLAASQSHLWRAKSLLMCVFHNISPQRSSWQSNSYSSDISFPGSRRVVCCYGCNENDDNSNNNVTQPMRSRHQQQRSPCKLRPCKGLESLVGCGPNTKQNNIVLVSFVY